MWDLPTSNMDTARLTELRKQLQWMRPAWLAAQRAYHIATNTHIAGFNLEDPLEIDLPAYVKDLDDIEYFSVTYSSTNASKPAMDRQLIEAAL